MYVCRATKQLEDHTVILHDFKNFIPELDRKNIILAPFCGEPSCEEAIKKESTRYWHLIRFILSWRCNERIVCLIQFMNYREEVAADVGPAMGAKSLCIPFEQPDATGKAKPVAECACIYPKCSLKPKFYCLFGRSYWWNPSMALFLKSDGNTNLCYWIHRIIVLDMNFLIKTFSFHVLSISN